MPRGIAFERACDIQGPGALGGTARRVWGRALLGQSARGNSRHALAQGSHGARQGKSRGYSEAIDGPWPRALES
eukprot:1059958-Pyramimonas_sp.AAC.1